MEIKMQRFFLTFFLCVPIFAIYAEETPREERLAFIGDSITAGNSYAVQMEIYLKACAGKRNLKVRSFAFPGDTALGFNKRIDEVLAWKPTVATIQFGMNDGFYGRYTDWMGNNYLEGVTKAIRALRKMNCAVYLATPTVMDPVYGKPNSIYAGKCNAETYNLTLKKLAEFTGKISKTEKIPQVELFELMSKVMTQCKKEYGNQYVFAGSDGIHPGPNGQLVIAYAFLESLGMEKKVARITVDMEGDVSLSEGHKVASRENNELVLESTRYPFCHSSGTEDILPFLPFQEKFNRFELKFVNLPSGNYKVTWGTFSKNFSSEALQEGINLADEFRINPFNSTFAVLYKQIECKQRYETSLVFELFPKLRNLQGANGPEIAETLKKELIRHREILEREISLPPVNHKIRIEKINQEK